MLMEKWTKGNRVLEIHTDELPAQSPRKDFDNLGVMYCWHRDLDLGDAQPQETMREFYQTVLAPDKGHVLAMYLYDRSGLCLSAAPFGCKWDSGQLGFIHMPKAAQEKEGMTDEQALACLHAEVQMYHRYIVGEVFGYNIYTPGTCSECGHTTKKEENSCWGFYGSDHKESGLLESAGLESLEGWTDAKV